METLFMRLYPLAGLLFVIGYVPQIMKLVQATQPPTSVSLTSWGIWLKGNLITLGYVEFTISDDKLAITTMVCLVLSLCVIGLTYYNANHRFGQS